MEKLDDRAEDTRVGPLADLKDLDAQMMPMNHNIRQTGTLPYKLAYQRQARSMETMRDEAWRASEAAATEIEVQEDRLPGQVEEFPGQGVSDEQLAAVRFEIV